MVRALLVVLGMLGAALAQSSAYTGPMFDPGNAPFFGASSLVIPTLSNAVPTTEVTPTFIRSRVSSAASAAISGSALLSGSATRNATVSASPTPSSNSTSSSVVLSSSVSRSSSLATSASRTSSATSSASAPAQSTGAAIANVPGAVGAIVGGVFAGLAML
ncbi:hypothetical protein EK21DRAFT_116885 [Setomelanomma holmii]|uniref:Uncharacterized protein n=1 Tax=Setomelanomma holmii TaxID=210430 RepID=A0A9P4H025_9PLEO|nr:hypothetical protein EK21DRAFT_116885 [Setomelanomma holmii]